MSARFEVGEHVDVTIRGARVVDTAGEGFAPMLALMVSAERVELPLSASVTVTRTAPAEWPPQIEDTWQDAMGRKWFAVGDGGTGVDLIGRSGGRWSPDVALRDFGPFALVARDGWSPTRTMVATVTVDEPEPAEADRRAAWIADMREALDWLEAHPEVPRPYLGFGGSTQLQHDDVAAMPVYEVDRDRTFAEVRRAMGADAVDEVAHGQFIAYRRFGAVAITVSKPEPEPAPAEPVTEAAPAVDERTLATAELWGRAAADDDRGDETPMCPSTLADPDADHTHRCALYVDAGPHTGDHVCITPDCAAHWADVEAGAL